MHRAAFDFDVKILGAVLVLVTAGAASAEPCPSFKLTSKVLAKASTGGVLVGEVPIMDDYKHPITTDRSDWRIRVDKKVTTATSDVIAPGLVVYRLPKDAKKVELLDADKKVVGTATDAKATELAKPEIVSVTSGTTKSVHPTRFVNVELGKPAPAGAFALVLVDANNAAMSWGLATREATNVNVYSTQSGCVLVFPTGTAVAEVGKTVSAFWIDAGGRRSSTSAKIVVTEP